MQQEISAAADAAVRKYKEDTAADEVTKEGAAEAMRISVKESTDKLYKKLSKIVSVANPALGSDWLKEVRINHIGSLGLLSFHFIFAYSTYCFTLVQIERHWSQFAVPELTLEKLQLIATANVSPTHKVKWLKWMNASAYSREARRFPPRPANEEKLQAFLTRACWFAGVCFWFLTF